jgi:hypothetical protein
MRTLVWDRHRLERHASCCRRPGHRSLEKSRLACCSEESGDGCGGSTYHRRRPAAGSHHPGHPQQGSHHPGRPAAGSHHLGHPQQGRRPLPSSSHHRVIKPRYRRPNTQRSRMRPSSAWRVAASRGLMAFASRAATAVLLGLTSLDRSKMLLLAGACPWPWRFLL